jgi:HSP20 family protein
MDRLRRQMNRLFSDFPSFDVSPAPTFPAMNVWTNEEGVVVTAELPGCNPDNIEISVVGETLSIAGQRAPDALSEESRYHRQERSCGSFNRSFQLPFGVEADAVEATFEDGVLHIALPRAEAEKPRKITISKG